MEKKVIALAGNPNSGKTTLFNNLTGSTAYVGNWPGVTVEQRKGHYKKDGKNVEIVDLPGIYSLSPYTPEEVIARNYILDEKPDAIINIVDSTNLERNLYLTTQLMEMDVPIVVALNMTDALEKNQQRIDAEGLSKALGVPVVNISALKNRGIKELMEVACNLTTRKGTSVLESHEVNKIVKEAKAIYEKEGIKDPLFHAIKALEKDEIELEINKEVATKASNLFDGEFDAVSADERYKYIAKEFSKFRTGKKEEKAKNKLSISDKIDRVLTNKWAGIPIFLVALFLIFELTFSEDLFFLARAGVQFTPCFEGTMFEGLFWTNAGINSPGVILTNFLNGILGTNDVSELTFGWGGIARSLDDLLVLWNTPDWLAGLIDTIVIDGVFAMLGFLPQILVLFTFFSLLEDVGYMARVAFIFDRIFRRMGLSGRALIPMLMGYGCGVPAMINTRTLSSDKERIATIRAIAYFPCGAKVTLLAAIAGVLAGNFNLNASAISYSFYIIGLVIAIAAVILMHWTTLREKTPPFIMELPAYHAPQFKSLMIHIWDKTKHYIKKITTIIVVSALVIWFGTHFTWSFWTGYIDPEEVGYAGTILGDLCSLLSVVFVPLGFGPAQVGGYAWAYTLSSLTGIVAKEVVPDTLIIIAGDAGFETFVAESAITVGGFMSFVVFNLMTIPCFASIATAKAELGKGQIGKTILFWIVTSYLLGMITYLVIDHTWTLAIFIPLIIAVFACAYLYNKKMNEKEARAA